MAINPLTNRERMQLADTRTAANKKRDGFDRLSQGENFAGFMRFVARSRSRDLPCDNCGEAPAQGHPHHVDHIVPRRYGGTDDDQNLQLLCNDCHVAKTELEINEDIERQRQGTPLGRTAGQA